MRIWQRRAFWAGVLWSFLLLSSCQAPERGFEERCAPLSALPAPTPEELAYLDALRTHHLAADEAEARGDREAALHAMEEALGLPPPKGATGEAAYLDAVGRAGQILLDQKRLDEALQLVQKAQAASAHKGFYLAALLLLEGEAHQARADMLGAADQEGRAAAQKAALKAYESAQALSRRILERNIPTQRGGSP